MTLPLVHGTVFVDKNPRSRAKPWWAQCDILGHDNEFILQEKPEKCKFCEKERLKSTTFYPENYPFGWIITSFTFSYLDPEAEWYWNLYRGR